MTPNIPAPWCTPKPVGNAAHAWLVNKTLSLDCKLWLSKNRRSKRPHTLVWFYKQRLKSQGQLLPIAQTEPDEFQQVVRMQIPRSTLRLHN